MDNEHPDGELMRYVVITQDLLGASDLNANEKIVLAYISSFKEYYAANESAGAFLGLSTRIVERAKQKLTRLGYIRIIKKTGRGNVYAFNLERLAKIGGADSPKMADQTRQNWRTEIKEEIKDLNSKGDETVADESPKQYGREDINEIVDLWESETGTSIKGQQNQRRQVYNLIRKHGAEATKALVMLVGEARRSGDQFAPQIATPSDLTGKYSKLERLRLWDNRRKLARPFGQSTPAPAILPPPAMSADEWDRRYGVDSISDEERAEVSQRFKEARKTLPFLKKGGNQ